MMLFSSHPAFGIALDRFAISSRSTIVPGAQRIDVHGLGMSWDMDAQAALVKPWSRMVSLGWKIADHRSECCHHGIWLGMKIMTCFRDRVLISSNWISNDLDMLTSFYFCVGISFRHLICSVHLAVALGPPWTSWGGYSLIASSCWVIWQAWLACGGV